MIWAASSLVPGCAGMRLHDDRAARGESRRGIATGNGKSKRKVTRPEDNHRAEGAQHRPNVRAWQGLAIRKSRIDSRLHPRAFLDDSGEHAQLVRGAAYLAEKARHGQRRLLVRSLGQLLFCSFESVGNTAQKGCAGFARGLRIAGEGLRRELNGLFHLGRRRRVVDRFQQRAGLRIRPVKACAAVGAALVADKGMSGEFHGHLRLSRILPNHVVRLFERRFWGNLPSPTLIG